MPSARLPHTSYSVFLSQQPGRTLKAKFLMTCRQEPDILEFNMNGDLQIDSGEVNADLSKFIQAKVSDLSSRKKYPPGLTHDIEDTFRKKAGGTFLWASLVLEDLRNTKLL
jgi:hypothetical protein